MNKMSSQELMQSLRQMCVAVWQVLITYERSYDPDELDHLIYHMRKLYRVLLAVEDCDNSVLEHVAQIVTLLQELQDRDLTCNTGYVVDVVHQGTPGCPRFNMSKEQLEYLLGSGFHCTRIETPLGVSLRTVRRRMSEFGLSVHALYSHVSNEQLDIIVRRMKHDFPNCGYRLLQGHLLP